MPAKYTARQLKTVREIITSLPQMGDAAIAEELNKRGIQTARGLSWSPRVVSHFRCKFMRRKIRRKSMTQAAAQDDTLAFAELAMTLDVPRETKNKILRALYSKSG